jgi:chromosome segregation ATPase
MEYRYAEQKGINDEAFKKDEELSRNIQDMAKELETKSEQQQENSFVELNSLREQIAALAEKQEEASAAESAGKAAASAADAASLQKLQEDLEGLKKEATSAAEDSEAVAKLRGDLQALKQGSEEFQTNQSKTNEEQTKKNEAMDQVTKAMTGFEEKFGSLVQEQAELLGKVETKAENKDLQTVRARVEGGFNALVTKMEADRWIRSQADVIADGISQNFLGLIDSTCEKLSLRVQKVESALSDTSA